MEIQDFPLWVKLGLVALAFCGFIGFSMPDAPLIFRVASPVGAAALGVALLMTKERAYRSLSFVAFGAAILGTIGLVLQLTR